MFKPALHSVSYAGVWPGQARLALPDFLARAARLGFGAVMLMAKRPHLSLLDMSPPARREVKQVADGHGLRVAVLAGYNDFAAGADVPDVPLREMQVYYVGELARLAADLGCPVVRVFTAFERPGVPYQAAWDQAVAGLREAARRAADFGVTLGVQNHHDVAVHYQSLADLLAEVGEPNCKACFDAWAHAPVAQAPGPDFRQDGGDLAAAVKVLAPYLVHTTVADYVHRPRFKYEPALVNYTREADALRAVPMGEGFLDYPAFFAALREIGYQGDVAYEMCSPLRGGGGEENLDRCAAKFLRYMKQLEEGAGAGGRG
jgi:sugar phosphate isomerase/epimerase